MQDFREIVTRTGGRVIHEFVGDPLDEEQIAAAVRGWAARYEGADPEVHYMGIAARMGERGLEEMRYVAVCKRRG